MGDLKRESGRCGSALRMLQDRVGALVRLRRVLAAAVSEGMVARAQGAVVLAASESAPTSCGGIGDHLPAPTKRCSQVAMLDVAVAVGERGFVIARVCDSSSERAPSCLEDDLHVPPDTVAHVPLPPPAGALAPLCDRAQRSAPRCCRAGFEACWLVRTGTG